MQRKNGGKGDNIGCGGANSWLGKWLWLPLSAGLEASTSNGSTSTVRTSSQPITSPLIFAPSLLGVILSAPYPLPERITMFVP